MNLTTIQTATLKADILADPTLSQIDHTSNAGYEQIAAAYNLFPGTDFFIYRSSVPVQDIYDQIVWANLTPNDPPTDATPTNDSAVTLQRWNNRSLMCQAKQFNLQIMLQGQTSINANKANVRAGLQDALTNVPSGAGGATASVGWVPIRDTLLARKATRGEKLFAVTSAGHLGGTAAAAAALGAEGAMSPGNISEAFS